MNAFQRELIRHLRALPPGGGSMTAQPPPTRPEV